MNEIVQAVMLMRNYGLHCMLLPQSLAQLKALCPAEHEVLDESCGTILNSGHGAFSMWRQMADLPEDFGR